MIEISSAAIFEIGWKVWQKLVVKDRQTNPSAHTNTEHWAKQGQNVNPFSLHIVQTKKEKLNMQ